MTVFFYECGSHALSTRVYRFDITLSAEAYELPIRIKGHEYEVFTKDYLKWYFRTKHIQLAPGNRELAESYYKNGMKREWVNLNQAPLEIIFRKPPNII